MTTGEFMGPFLPDSEAKSPSYFAEDAVATFGRLQVADIVQMAQQSIGISRYCLHNNTSDSLHSMIIAQSSRRYWRPKKHSTKDKVFHIVQGHMAVIEFHDGGNPRRLTVLASDQVIAMRIPRGTFHTNFALTSIVVHHEIIEGPYREGESDRIEADFAPANEDQEAGQQFIRGALEVFGLDWTSKYGH